MCLWDMVLGTATSDGGETTQRRNTKEILLSPYTVRFPFTIFMDKLRVPDKDID